MVQKRGTLIYLVLVLVLFLSLVSGRLSNSPGSPDYQETILHSTANKPDYTYVLGIRGYDDDDEPCETSLHASFGIVQSSVLGNTLNADFPPERNLDCGSGFIDVTIDIVTAGMSGCDDEGPAQCSWKNLPLSSDGCYFLTSEWDSPDNPNDCAGWVVPAGEASFISRTIQTNANDYLMAATGDPNALVSKGFPTFGITNQFLDSGGYSTEYEPTGSEAICIFRAQQFSSLDKAFQCFEDEDEFRWYICDENNLYDTTGKFIPVEPEIECDSTHLCPEQASCQSNICIDDMTGQPLQGDKTAWICEKNLDGTYAWNGAHALTCADLETLGESCHNDEQVCNSNGFSWTPTADGGYCCGYGGIEDLGKPVTTPDDKNLLCLNKNEELVGRDTSSSDSFASCTNNWCWLEAADINTKFRIFTLKKPGEPTYDVVSNNNDWYACDGIDGEGNQEISAAGAIFNRDDMDDANRFYCYKEGNRWSWADCRDPLAPPPAFSNGIKERAPGDGLFAFKNPNPPMEPERAGIWTEPVFVDVETAYASYYGDDSRLDFKGYTPMYLEFYVRFTTLDLNDHPEVRLTIKGPQVAGQSLIYYDQSVLGYAVNNPLLEENRWIHLKVPLNSEMLDVKSLEIASLPSSNHIEVRNIYLSDGSSPLCSGMSSTVAGEKAWLENLDFSSSQSDLSGEKLCNALFDPGYQSSADNDGKAWLGDSDDNVEPDAYCCGNGEPGNEAEYYAGLSRLMDGKYYGCWNSEPIASGSTTMNVEVEVEYKKNTVPIRYPTTAVSVNYFAKRYAEAHYFCYDNCPRSVETLDANGQTASSFSYDQCHFSEQSIEGCDIPIESILRLGGAPAGLTDRTFDNFAAIPADFLGAAYLREENKIMVVSKNNDIFNVPTFSLSNSPLSLGPVIINKDDFAYLDGFEGSISLEGFPSNLVDFYFLNPLTGDELGAEVAASALPIGTTELLIMAKVNDGYFAQNCADPNAFCLQPREESVTQSFTFSCPPSEQSECFYPLPGEQPYTITNKHPDLYELYFVPEEESGRPEPVLVTPSLNRFRQPGMIQARKVAQQVVFVNEGEDADEDPKFYGCQAASYVEQAPQGQAEFENLNYCSTQAERFCAYSVTQQDHREKFTTINSWSDEPLTKVGYQPIDQVSGTINNFYDSIELQLRETGADLPYEPTDRNHSASVLPTRNFIPNAQFLRSGMSIPHWDIRKDDGTRKENLRSNLVNDELHRITLESDETLRSEQIAVPQNTKLSFSATATCTPTIKLVDKDGVVVPITVPTSFNTGSASYLQLEFRGACALHSPLLQVVDDLPPVTFNYLHQEYPDGFDARAGAACCPQNYCWNGYACVAPMGSSTYLAEHVADGRDYRCIEGEWKYLPLQFDWNGQKWGFCSQPEQCLVLPSTSSGSAEYKASDFYDGHYPTCINDKEYIFDNLCNKGNWTSRTKYVATKLLEVGENSDYVLYCADYREALLEFDGKENYLGGEFVQQPQNVPTLAGTLANAAPAPSLATCFNTIQDSEGRRLVSDEENTCINNVCVLKFKQGGNFKVAFATTVNKDILGEDSFLFALNIPSNRLNQLCTGVGDFVRCDLTGLNIPGDLWYAKKINATIYGRQGIQLTPTLIDRILTWLARFVGVQSELSDESAFISRAQNFREVYVLSLGDKKVRALKEVLSADQQTLLAEYEHFNTPVCDYVNNIAVPPEAGTELLEQLSGQQKIICTYNNNTGIQRVEAVAGLDFFWPQLTGRMRVG